MQIKVYFRELAHTLFDMRNAEKIGRHIPIEYYVLICVYYLKLCPLELQSCLFFNNPSSHCRLILQGKRC